MRRRSLVGPIFLIVIGVLFLAENIRPDLPLFQLVSLYWPFLLIGWGVIRLLEILLSAGRSAQMPRTGLTGGEVLLIVIVCLIGSALYGAHRSGRTFRMGPFGPRSIELFGEQFDYPVTGESQAGGAQRVVFYNLRGNLRITGADGDQVKVTGRKMVKAFSRADADQSDRQTPLEITRDGDRLVIRTNHERITGGRKVSEDLEISLPKRLAVEAHGSYGDLDINDLQSAVEITSGNAGVRLNRIGGDARIELSRSDIIRAVDVKGNIELLGRGADVDLENVQGQVAVNGTYSGSLQFKNLAKPLHFESRRTDLRVESLPGRLSIGLGEINGRNIIGPIRVVTKSNDLRFEEFTQSLELETERGDIDLRPGKLPVARIDVRSRNGNIDLALPEKARFELDAVTEHGEARNDYGPPIHAASEGRSASLKGTVGGGPVIKINTQRGSVAVRRASVEAKL